MKTKSFFNGLAVFALALVFAGCSDLLQTKNSSAGNASAGKNEAGTGSFEISVDAGERYIAAVDYDVNKIESWTIVLNEKTEEGEEPDPITLTWPTTGEEETSASSSPSVSYDKNSKTLHAQRIPTGKYDIELEGTYTENGIIVTLYGVKTDITVSSDSAKNSVKVLVGLKKQAGTSGSLSLGFTDNDNSLSLNSLTPIVTLTKIGGETVYSTEVPEGETAALNFEASREEGTSYTLTGSSLEPGWYKIEFEVSESCYTLRIPGDKTMVEIASGITTTATGIEISLVSTKSYYATNDASAVNKNGLAASSRKNINALLKKLAEGLPAVQEICIYMDDVPEIEVSALNGLATAMETQKADERIYIYDDKSALPVTFQLVTSEDSKKNPIYAAEIGIEGSVVLLGSEKDKVLTVSSFNTSGGVVEVKDVYITLKNGASLNLGDGVELSKNPLRLCADDFSSYSITPIVKTSTAYEAIYVELYKTGATEAPTTEYTLIQKDNGDSTYPYSYYVKPASDKVFGAVTASDALTITAYYTITTEGESGETTEKITVSDPIPYDDAALTFEISGMNGEIELKDVCYWYLNGKTIDTSNTSGDATFIFNPHLEDVEVDDKNIVSCYVYCGGELYLAEYTFEFSRLSPAVWMDSVTTPSNPVFNQVMYFDKGTPEEIGKQEEADFYTFDDECTLWTVTTGSEEGSLMVTSYPILLSVGKYSDKDKIDGVTGVSGSIVDVCYDVKTKALYVLTQFWDEVSGCSYNINKISRDEFYKAIADYENGTIGSLTMPVTATATVTLPTTDSTATGSDATMTQLAVCGSTFYFADSECKVYSVDIEDFTTDTSLETVNIMLNLKDSDLLTGFNEKLYKNDDYDFGRDSLSVTDLQVGDGFGNFTEDLYVLVREYSSFFQGDPNDNIFSRGALIKMYNNVYTQYGWWSESDTEKAFKLTPEDETFTNTFYTPSADSTDKFFGPVKFCAVAPKKLVVLDDGFIWSEEESKLKNKDSLVEFDIEKVTLTRKGAAISVSAPSGVASGYYSDKADWIK